jgi:hypothetical protein
VGIHVFSFGRLKKDVDPRVKPGEGDEFEALQLKAIML